MIARNKFNGEKFVELGDTGIKNVEDILIKGRGPYRLANIHSILISHLGQLMNLIL